jgi:inorganic pyrophosphatase
MRVFIQNESGSLIKNYHDEKTLQFQRSAKVSRAYPFPYGFILNTSTEDGLNVDCFVLTSAALKTGQIVACEPLGLMEQFEDGKEDHNVLAALENETIALDEAKKLALIEFVNHVFDHIPGKNIRVGGFHGKEAALQHISNHSDK